MPVLPGGDIWGTGSTVSGSKITGSKTWKFCPYSTQITNFNGDSRVPEIEKVFHSETDGRLHVYSIGGPIGWMCADNDCSYFTATATTEVIQQGRRFVAASGTQCTEEDLATLSGSVQHLTQGRAIVSGIRYYEI